MLLKLKFFFRNFGMHKRVITICFIMLHNSRLLCISQFIEKMYFNLIQYNIGKRSGAPKTWCPFPLSLSPNVLNALIVFPCYIMTVAQFFYYKISAQLKL